jgi:ribonuclease G
MTACSPAKLFFIHPSRRHYVCGLADLAGRGPDPRDGNSYSGEWRIFGKGNPLSTDILISSDPWENRVAILENGSLAEIYIEREEKVIGSIYKGKVQNVLPGMGASFVDIGLGRNAFLYVDDIHKAPLNIGDVEITQGRSGWTISDKVNRGDDVLVQIVKEPRGLKGARVSTNITLPGRYLILMPTGKYSGVSRKIESAEERTRLKNVMKRIRPDGMATVVRTAAAGVSDAELIADLGVLIRMWHGILENYKSFPAPALIHKDMNLVFKAARDFITPQVDRVLVDNPEESEKLRDFMRLLGPQYVDRISAYPQGRALFRDFKVEDEINRLMRPKVNLPSGGSLVIETTEALTVIDVNSGKFTGGKTQEDTIVHTNLEAAAEIARQVRLRDIGGIVVCDFIDMNTEASRTKVLQTLEAGLRRDRTRTTIQSFSALGLLEFTRKRVGKDLGGQLQSSCPTCRGLGNVLSPDSVAIEAFRQLRAANTIAHEERALSIVASPTVAAQLHYWYDDEVAGLAKEFDKKIQIVIDPLLHPERTYVAHGLTPTLKHIVTDRDLQSRVGDEHDVEILNVRMPNATSASAVIGGKLVEIENAQVTAGSIVGIRVIDVDGDEILAELRTQQVQGEGRKRRRRGGRSNKNLTPVEQTEELRELAEEAARLLGSRTAPPPEPTIAAPEAAEAIAPAAASAAPAYGAYPPETEEQKRRRRRRRRRGGRGNGPGAPGEFAEQAPTAAPTPSAAQNLESDEFEDESEEGGFEEGTEQEQPGATPGDQPRKRRRRRRRRRSNGAFNPHESQTGTSEPGAVPDRSIFSVDPNGQTESTGNVAPPEPSRALAPWNRRPGHVAVEPPPPSLSAPEEETRIARPARRRTTEQRASGPIGELSTTPPQPALPSGNRKEVEAPRASATTKAEPLEAPAPRRRGRPPKAATAAAAPAPVEAPAPITRTPRTSRTRPVTPQAAPAPTPKAAPKAVPEPEAPAPRKRGRPPKAAAPAAKAAPVKAAPIKKTVSRSKAAAPAKATTARKKKA